MFGVYHQHFAELQQKNLDQTEINRQKKENRAILQLGLIVGSYMLGYFPNCGNLL